jgi:hypothetical protein
MLAQNSLHWCVPAPWLEIQLTIDVARRRVPLSSKEEEAGKRISSKPDEGEYIH